MLEEEIGTREEYQQWKNIAFQGELNCDFFKSRFERENGILFIGKQK